MPSAAGVVSIGSKYLFESIFGVQYPRSFKTMEGPNPMDGEDTELNEEQPRKRRKTEDKKETGKGASGTVGSVGASSGSVVFGPISNFKTGKLIFNHKRTVYTHGYQFNCFKLAEILEDGNTQYAVTTSLARVPCHALPWYLTKTEFDSLPVGSQGSRFSTVIIPMGFRTPFITNSAGINSVNSNLFVQGIYAHGLNNKYNGCNFEIGTDVSNPMIPNSITRVRNGGLYLKDIWGSVWKEGENDIPFDDIPTCFGNMKPLRQYYAQNIDSRTGGPKLPTLQEDVSEFIFTNGSGNPPITWEYRPQVCVLKTQEPYPHFRNKYSGGQATFIYGTKVPFGYDAILNIDSDSKGQSIKSFFNLEKKV